MRWEWRTLVYINVAGGGVAMFSVISGSLSAAICRFITYELDKGGQINSIRFLGIGGDTGSTKNKSRYIVFCYG